MRKNISLLGNFTTLHMEGDLTMPYLEGKHEMNGFGHPYLVDDLI